MNRIHLSESGQPAGTAIPAADRTCLLEEFDSDYSDNPDLIPTDRYQRVLFWLAFAMVACLVGSLGASLGPELSYRDYRQVKAQISQLSQGDRERLERNLKTYQQMSSAEQEHYWELHRYVEKNGMMDLVRDYTDWLSTLSPLERQQLRKSTEPAARLAVVEKLLSDKHRQVEQRLPELIARVIAVGDSSNFFLRHLLRQSDGLDFTNPYILSKSQLETINRQVFLPQLTAAKQQQMSGYGGTEQIFRVLRAVLEPYNDPQDSWPSDRTFRLLEENGVVLNTTNPELEARLKERPLEYSPWRRFAFRRLIIRSLLVAELQDFEVKTPVRDAELMSYFERLDSSAQATLLDSPADYQKEALKWLYLWQKHREDSNFAKDDFRIHVLGKMAPRGFRPGGPPPEGWGPGGPDGRGPDGRGPEGRGPGGPDSRFGGERRGSGRGPDRDNSFGRPPLPPPENRERPPGERPPGEEPRGTEPPPRP